MANNERVARVREFYRLGQEVDQLFERARAKTGSVYGRATVAKLAKRKKVSRAAVYQAKLLVELYTKAEVEKLAREGVSKTHFLLLVEIDDDKLRKKLTDGCRRGWTTRELEVERQRVKPRRFDGRSPVLKPISRQRTAPEVKRRAKSWVRWAKSVNAGDLPRGTKKAFRDAQAAMRGLVESL